MIKKIVEKNRFIKKFFANMCLFAMIFNLFSFQAYAQKNELLMKHDSTEYLDFGKFKLNLNTDYSINNSLGAYSYSDGASGTGDLSLKYDNKFNVKVGRILTSSGYVFVLSGWTYEDGGDGGDALGWIQLSNYTDSNNIQNPINKSTLLVDSDNQDDTNYGVWIDYDGFFHGKGKVDSDGSDVVFTGTSAVSPKPFDIDGDGLSNSEEVQIFGTNNNVGDIDGDGFTDGERDWDSDGDTFNDKLDPFPMDPDKNNCTLDTKPTPNFCKEVDGKRVLDDSVFKDSDGNWLDSDGDGLTDFLEYQFGTDKDLVDTDGDGLSDFLEYQFGLDGNDSTDANGDFDDDGISNIDEILGLDLNIVYLDSNGVQVSYTGHMVTDFLNPDTDGDSLKDGDEIINRTDPLIIDTDLDNIPDGIDNYPLDGSKPGNDGKDWSDGDNDGLPKWWEDKYTNGNNSGIASDGTTTNEGYIRIKSGSNLDEWVDANGNDFGLDSGSGDTNNDLILDGSEDFDNDGLVNYKEYINGTNPNNWDSDGDHLSDSEDPEKNIALDPNGDQDGDTISNINEIDGWTFDLEYKTTTGSIYSSGSFLVKTKYNNNDSDSDWLTEQEEFQKGTNPLSSDTDGDGYSDYFELSIGYDPLNGYESDNSDTVKAVPQDDDLDGLLNDFEEKYSKCGPDSENIYAMSGSLQSGFSTNILSCDSDDYLLKQDDNNSDGDGIYDKDEDFDNDGLTNFEEQLLGTDPNNWDTDGDGIPDFLDPNPLSSVDITQDTDGDGYTDNVEILGVMVDYNYGEYINDSSCTEGLHFKQKLSLNYNKKDSDSDGLDDKYEIQNGFNPLNPDMDGDGVLDGEEIKLGFDPKNGCVLGSINGGYKGNVPIDDDKDGLLTSFENKYTNGGNELKVYILNIIDGVYKTVIGDGNEDIYKLDYQEKNSDGDDIKDPDEDFDNDGQSNRFEQINGTNPNSWDSDNDGIEDGLDNDPIGSTSSTNGESINLQFIDSDGDGISDKDEIELGTDPNNPDSDGDGIPDGVEVAMGTNPNNNSDKPLDTDGDGFPDVFEDLYTPPYDKNDANKPDPSGNGISGGIDTDGDGLTDYYEMIIGTDPTDPDYDNDGIPDGIEVTAKKLGDTNADPLDGSLSPLDIDGDGFPDVFEDLYAPPYDKNDVNKPGDSCTIDNCTLDSDGDGLSDLEELMMGTNPLNSDTDGDGTSDLEDINPNNPLIGNSVLVNSNIYGKDSDGDGLSDLYENQIGTDPNNPDSDGDGIPDGIELSAKNLGDINSDPMNSDKKPVDTDGDWLPDVFEKLYPEIFDINNYDSNGNGLADGFEDTDNDGIINIYEMIYGTNPTNPDTDGDGVLDGIEITASKLGDINGNPTNSEKKPLDTDFDGIPDIYETQYSDIFTIGTVDNLNQDSDNDGVSNLDELKNGTNPQEKDSDGDGIIDSIDIFPNYSNNGGIFSSDELENNLKLIDSDGDGISDYDEIYDAAGNIMSPGTNPYNPDSDGDGISDGIENQLGMNPNDDSDKLDDIDGDLLPNIYETGTYIMSDNFTENFNLGNYFKMDYQNKNTYSTNFLDSYADADHDFVLNIDELLYGTSPYSEDTDGDGVSDGIEVVAQKLGDTDADPLNGEKTPVDSDSDGIPDVYEDKYSNIFTEGYTDNGNIDSDGDGLSNLEELIRGTNPMSIDSDGDGVSDSNDINPTNSLVSNGYENPTNYILPENGDSDLDGISNIDEYNLGSNPNNPDSDGDGINDGIELAAKKLGDTDADSLNGEKTPIDSDSDGIPDVIDNLYTFTNGLSGDDDGDGLSNLEEILEGTDPFSWDSDGDGVPDGIDSNPNESNFTGDPSIFIKSLLGFPNKAYEDAMRKYWNYTGSFTDTDFSGSGDLLDDHFELFNHKHDPEETSAEGETLDDINDPYGDKDGDGVSNYDELLQGTSPYSKDTDGDGIPDGTDLAPTVPGNGIDTDNDGIYDFNEIHGFTGKVLIDGNTEYKHFITNELKYDSDGDGLSDGFEIQNQLNPLLKDTDNDGWEDGVEVNVSYIKGTFFSTGSDVNNSNFKPLDDDNGNGTGDGLPDKWEKYYTSSDDLSILSKDGDNDNDGFSNYMEAKLGTDPLINNFEIQIKSSDVSVINGSCEGYWTNKGEKIELVIPGNLNNIDLNNSGFYHYSNNPKKYDLVTLPESIGGIVKPMDAGRFVNKNNSNSSLKNILVSTGSFSKNSIPIGPNKISITLKEDSYEPYIGLKIKDFISGKIPDPLFSENEKNGFLANQKSNEKDIYLGKSCVDATKPVCSIILSGGNHEQNHGLNIPVSWNEKTGWISLDGTASGKNLSLLSDSSKDETKKFNIFEKILNSLGVGEKKYEGDYSVKTEGYIPWTRGTGSTALDKALKFAYDSEDNLSGTEKADIKIFNYDEVVNGFTGSTLSTSLPSGADKLLCSEYDASDNCTGTGGLSGKRVGVKIFDKAGNYNYCQSAVSKVDDSFPLVKFAGIKDYKDEKTIGQFASKVGTLLTNRGYTFYLDLDDTVTYDGEVYDFSVPGVNVANGNSGFNPSDFGKGKIMFCGKGVSSESCTNDILSHDTDDDYLNEKYVYSETGSTSSGIFVEGIGDLISPEGILFEKDAYFALTGVILTGSTLNVVYSDDGKDILSVDKGSNGTIKISDGTGSQLEQVLFVENGSHSGAYLSTIKGLYKIDDAGGWTPNGIKVFNEDRMLGENEIPKRSGKVAFKIYSKTGDEGPGAGDYFYISFDFMDRAGNGLPLKYGFTLKENIFAKILGNIQSGQKTSTFDDNVQTFELKESVVKTNVEKIKSNISNILTNAKDANGSGIIVEKLSDLNPYKVALGDESIYLVKNGDIILGTGSSTLKLTDDYGKPVSIITYGGNIILNSKYIEASENNSFVALVDPSLANTSLPNSRPIETQGNILVSPELLIGKGQIIAEGSIMSFANINGKIQTVFNLDERRTLFKNQLVWDGTMISNNTVGGFHQDTCPVAIYGFGNTCGFDKETQYDKLKAAALTYDLHYLRTYSFDGSTSSLNGEGISTLTSTDFENSGTPAGIMSNVFEDNSYLSESIPEVNFNTNFSPKQVLNNDTLSATLDTNLKNTIKGLEKLFQYPVIIKHSVPSKDMKIFK